MGRRIRTLPGVDRAEFDGESVGLQRYGNHHLDRRLFAVHLFHSTTRSRFHSFDHAFPQVTGIGLRHRPPPAKEKQCTKTRSSITLWESRRFKSVGNCISLSSLSLNGDGVVHDYTFSLQPNEIPLSAIRSHCFDS